MADSILPIAGQFKINAHLIGKNFKEFTPEDIIARPNESTNSSLFILGHITHHRHVIMGLLGVETPEPWAHLFGRGVKILTPDAYPAFQEILLAFAHVTTILDERLTKITDGDLDAPSNFAPPMMRPILRDSVAFLAYHEAYHVGQLAYIRRLLGYNQLVG